LKKRRGEDVDATSKKVLTLFFFNKYDEFAKVLGYTDWKVSDEKRFMFIV
jgi:hypothetical protein